VDRQDPLARVFPGDSEMAARMRGFDWSTTDLGRPGRWPRTLRAAVRICLLSRFPIVLWWGPELTMLYNDAYVSFLGPSKHPWVLGRPAWQAWPEVWDTIGPMLDRVRDTKSASWSEDLLLFFDREIAQEEVYLTLSFSPLIDDLQQVAGVFGACTETTEKLVGARRLETLRRLSIRAGEVQTVPDACAAACDALADNPYDIPFAAIYTVDEHHSRATLAASAGLPERHPLPPIVRLDEGGAPPWPLASVLHTRQAAVVGNLVQSGLGLPGGPWDALAHSAMVLPIPAPAHDAAAGVLVAGVNPRRVADTPYRSFLDLVAGHIGTAIADAEAYEAQRQRSEALAELDRAKTRFFNNISHEFRTPLTLMLGLLKDAVTDLTPESRLALGFDVETVYRNANRLLRLVNTLLDFARIEAHRVQPNFEPTDLTALTQGLAGVFRAAIERGGLAFTVRCDPLPAPVYVDRDMWEKIVLNLISNAFKFTLEGGIEVTLGAAGERVEFTVRDTGCGIADADLPRLFERFHRVEGARARTHEGSGIGLALVQELVRMHGGEIHADSRIGVGTTFTVSVPAGAAHLPADRIAVTRSVFNPAAGASAFVDEALRWLPAVPGTPESATLTAAAPERPDEPLAATILVADDNADMREYVARLLAQRWAVEAVADGEAALAAVRRRRFDLVLTDAGMPKLNGFALLEVLRADATHHALPVIMLSAHAGEESRIRGLQDGADDYLVKPFSARELIARVDSHLKLAARRQLAADHAALTRLHEASARLTGEEALSNLLDAVAEAALPLSGTRMSTVQLYDAATGSLRLVAHRGFEQAFLDYFATVGDVPTPCGEAARRRERVIVHDVLSCPILAGSAAVGVFTAAGVRAIQSTPLVARDGALLGVFSTHWPEPHSPAPGTLRILDLLARHAADLVEHRQREEQLREANRRKDEFMAILGHELRNPLAPIVIALELIKRRGFDPFADEHALIEQQVRHMVRLVDDLLDVSRITRGAVELHKRRLRLDQLVNRAVEMARPLIDQRGHELSVLIPRVELDGDEGRLAQVISNLLVNAAAYTAPGGHIAVRAYTEAGDVVITIADDGMGIAGSLLPRVFDLFSQASQPEDRAAGGLGLGLAIVRSLVEQHGGSVAASSRGPGRGSAFTIRLPATGTAHVVSSDTTTDAGAAPVTPMRVLLVEDNDSMRYATELLLRIAGHQPLPAKDGWEALRIARTSPVDVAVLDLGLPVMSGYELATRLRAELGDAAPRLIALSGYGQASDRERSTAAGFALHFVKPVSPRLLLQAIDGDHSLRVADGGRP
jgi:signal transduction histidine kinase/DNA-binding response OmpR family regulator